MREIPFGQDGSYGHEAFVNRTNADLANDIGNLAQRSLSMIAKNCDGKVPAPGAFSDEDKAILQMADDALVSARAAMADQAIHAAIAATFAVVAEANRYFAGQEPWALKKTDPARMATVLYVTAEVIRRVAIQCQAVMPQSAAKLLDLVAAPQNQRDFAFAGEQRRACRRHAACPCRSLCFRAMWMGQKAREPCWLTAIAISIFRILTPSAMPSCKRAEEAGVGLMVSISTRVRKFDRIRAIAEAYPNVFCSVGTHPAQCGRGNGCVGGRADRAFSL